ncbi:MAG: hypothetical protein KAW39_04035 [Thermoplasmata archaeon]|nr:hypothetical protein [Thermoplasmata archaeon]
MRLQAVVLLLSLILLLPYAAAADDPTRVDRVNKLMSNFSTPQLAPGESGTFAFDVVNTNENNMTNISLTMSIYMFATAEETKDVDDNWSTPLIRNTQEQRYTFPPFDLNGTLAENNTERLSVTIDTSVHTVRGGVFDQGTYFVRFRMEFDYVNESGPGSYLMASRGYFTDQMWEDATNDTNVANCDPADRKGDICLTYLGVDGIIPDSSFGVKEPMPMWPFYTFVVLAGFFLFLALMFHLEENPGTWPWMERKWRRFRGLWRQTFQKPKRPKK